MSSHLVIGIDPGPIPGVTRLRLDDGRLTGAEVLQCTASALYDVLRGLDFEGRAVIAAERYVDRGRTNAAQALTRDQVGALEQLYPGARLRTAAQVKPWATNDRLNAAGLLDLCTGMRHARDSARHALFTAVRDLNLTDPLSKEYR